MHPSMFLPMQLISKAKTNQVLPKVSFPEGYSLSANVKHCSNEKEFLKILDKIILPNIRQERKNLGCENQKALMIYDAIRDRITDKALKSLGGQQDLGNQSST